MTKRLTLKLMQEEKSLIGLFGMIFDKFNELYTKVFWGSGHQPIDYWKEFPRRCFTNLEYGYNSLIKFAQKENITNYRISMEIENIQ